MPAARAQEAIGAVFGEGAQGVELCDSETGGAAPGWVRVRSWHPAETDATALRARLTAQLGDGVEIHFATDDNPWQAGLVSAEARLIGAGFAIVEADETPVPAGRRALRIAAGSAFGEGAHPTTALCVEALEAWRAAHAPPPSALDVGTGTGVLALVVVALGVPRVRAIDIDGLARAAARRHAAQNGMAEHIAVAETLPPVQETQGLIVANLPPGPLLALSAEMRARLAPGGALIVSGFATAQIEAITAAFAPLAATAQATRDGFACLVLTSPEEAC
ncbi:MAG: 50S ribosomal protein L11 methyltransferase [Myxococcales bacterium]|nr:50S ribosomal protein L11 methyltransferase [Myxococcales bacterium]